MKGRTFRRCASCGRSPGAVAAGRRCPVRDCNGRVTWAWSINLGKVKGKRRRLTGSSDEWGENFQTEAVARETLDKKLQVLSRIAGSRSTRRCCEAKPRGVRCSEWVNVRRTSGLRASTVSANEGAHSPLHRSGARPGQAQAPLTDSCQGVGGSATDRLPTQARDCSQRCTDPLESAIRCC